MINHEYDNRCGPIYYEYFDHLQCDHCFCVEEVVKCLIPIIGLIDRIESGKPHRQCCKCGDIRSTEFIR